MIKEFGDNFDLSEDDTTNEWVISVNEVERLRVNKGTSTEGGEGDLALGPEGKILVNKDNISDTNHDKIIGEDEYGNQVVVPDGFKVADDSGENVKTGIVIEDSEGNQYVWVPISNINHDGSNKIKVNSAEEEGVEITLGRYTFNETTGNEFTTEGTYQYGVNYSEQIVLSDNYSELSEYRQSNGRGDSTGTNTTAKNLRGFIDSVRDNKGYYIARYEASYRDNGKVGSKISTSSAAVLALTSAPTSRTTGELWNFINQGEASIACQELYTTINSDLINSYAWDTAIIYIQAMGNSNYANKFSENNSIRNTGTNNDEVCKINDMASNTDEYTTEYSNRTGLDTSTWTTYSAPCTIRGGCFSMGVITSGRNYASANNNYNWEMTFRPILYLK